MLKLFACSKGLLFLLNKGDIALSQRFIHVLVFFLLLLLQSLLPPRKSWRFLFLSKATTEGFFKIFPNLDYICKYSNFFCKLCVLDLGRILLKVTIKGVFFIVFSLAFTRNFIPGIAITIT